MVKLKCLAGYNNKQFSFEAGQVFEVDDVTARWLQADSPGAFEVVVEPAEPEGKAMEAPPVDKMMRAPARKKGATK